MAGVVAVAASFAVGASTGPLTAGGFGDAARCCTSIGATASAPGGQSGMQMVAAKPAAQTVWRVAETPHALPAGVAPENGLQVRTILVARSISAQFPDIHQIGGVRPDSLRWHPDGLALDVIIPNPGSAEGIALGNQVVDFALEHADRFGLQDVIWRGVYYTPAGPSGSGYGHYDHVHITTTGGGYPIGGEVYIS